MSSGINYNDKRFKQVNSEKSAAVKKSNKTYDQMIDSSDEYFQQQADAIENWGETQTKNQQEQTDFAIEQIEQQKDQAHKDYLKEQSGAYVDWQKQKNDYGTNAEKMASKGFASTGYSESSQVAMYNEYQNRVATARESYSKAVLNYDNAIKEAQLQNNSVLAEIAYNTLQQSLELSLQGFQYKNQLVLEKANAKKEIDSTYYSRYQDVLSQLNTEKALAEQVRQYNANLAEEKRQFNETMAYNRGKNNSPSGSSVIKKETSSNTQGTTNKKNKSSSNATDVTSNKSSEYTVDMQSVAALGYGPINATKLNSLVASGEVIEYEEDGKLKYRRANTRSPIMLR